MRIAQPGISRSQFIAELIGQTDDQRVQGFAFTFAPASRKFRLPPRSPLRPLFLCVEGLVLV